MSVISRIAELKRKHAELSEKVEFIQRQPGSDDLEVASLKKQKLALKEEIHRLSA
ncbi:MAG: YdcH family protein [Pseudomonadota bacterium]